MCLKLGLYDHVKNNKIQKVSIPFKKPDGVICVFSNIFKSEILLSFSV